MWILSVYVLIVVVSETIVVAIGLILDRISPATQFTSFAIAFLCRPLVRLDSRGAVDRARTRKERKACNLKSSNGLTIFDKRTHCIGSDNPNLDSARCSDFYYLDRRIRIKTVARGTPIDAARYVGWTQPCGFISKQQNRKTDKHGQNF
jgi:hypothetical protein